MQGVFVVFCAFEFRALGYGYGSTEMLPGYNPILAAEVGCLIGLKIDCDVNA
jgi:hypothetical protein